ncbi:hypothetical protein D3C76_1710510 [compost metagenome]
MYAKQAVATTQVVVEKAKGAPLGQCHQPDRKFGEFDCQRVQINAIQAALGDEAARDH